MQTFFCSVQAGAPARVTVIIMLLLSPTEGVKASKAQNMRRKPYAYFGNWRWQWRGVSSLHWYGQAVAKNTLVWTSNGLEATLQALEHNHGCVR